MKHFILMFTVIVFLANIFAISAWAKPCNTLNDISPMLNTMSMEDIPCHEEQEQTQHCDGICLCLHTCINQTSVLNSQNNIEIPPSKSERLAIKNVSVASIATAPPRRPPKSIS